MKWLLSALGSTVTAAVLTHGGVVHEPPAGIQLVVHEPAASGGPGRLGAFEIDGLERAVSARAPLNTGTSSLELSLPPGLYGVRFVPDPEATRGVVLAMPPAVFLVSPRSVTRVDVHFRVGASPSSRFSERLAGSKGDARSRDRP